MPISKNIKSPPTPRNRIDKNSGSKANMRDVLMKENNKYHKQQAVTAKIEKMGLGNLGLVDFGVSGDSQNANNTTKATNGP